MSANTNIRYWAEILKQDYEEKGISLSKYSELVGLPKATLSYILNGQYDKLGKGTIAKLQKIFSDKVEYKGIVTNNLKTVFEAAEEARLMKKTVAIIGEGGYGKTYSLLKYREKLLKDGYDVLYVNAALAGATRKKLVMALIEKTGNYFAGTIEKQLKELKRRLQRKKVVVIIDEVSAMKGSHITILKDLIDSLEGVPIVLAGTPYFWQQLEKGANRNKHLYSELRDRIAFHVELSAPSINEAKAIFKVNGLTSEEIKEILTSNRDWLERRSFRAIRDAIIWVKQKRNVKLDLEYLSII